MFEILTKYSFCFAKLLNCIYILIESNNLQLNVSSDNLPDVINY